MDDDAGAGVVATMIIVPLVLVLLLFGTQVLLRLHATSTVTALAADATRDVAVAPGAAPLAARRAELVLRRDLGASGDSADIDWQVDGEVISVRVRVPAPAVLAIARVGTLGAPITVSATSPNEAWR